MRCGTQIPAVELHGRRHRTFDSIYRTFSSTVRTILRTSNMLDREPTTIPFSTEAMKANLLRLQNEWESVQASRDRNAIYQYLAAVFELVTWWAKEGRAVN